MQSLSERSRRAHRLLSALQGRDSRTRSMGRPGPKSIFCFLVAPPSAAHKVEDASGRDGETVNDEKARPRRSI
jgi:hypothetical protein